jgi:hypothetical protein
MLRMDGKAAAPFSIGLSPSGFPGWAPHGWKSPARKLKSPATETEKPRTGRGFFLFLL